MSERYISCTWKDNKIGRLSEPSFKRACHERSDKEIYPREISGNDAEVLLSYGSLV